MQPLREEVEEIAKSEGWTKAGLDEMHKMDSFIKESQRLHPIANRKWGFPVLCSSCNRNFFSSNNAYCGERFHVLRWHSHPSRRTTSRFYAHRSLRWYSLWRSLEIRWIPVFQTEGKFCKESRRNGIVESGPPLFWPWKTRMSWTILCGVRVETHVCAYYNDLRCEIWNWGSSSTGYVDGDFTYPESKRQCPLPKTNKHSVKGCRLCFQ